MDKIISIWKPIDITSYDVIRKLKKVFPKTKIGHCGTLDPFAEGVLVICMGKYTKSVSEIMSYKKTYEIEIKFGYETDTLDSTGRIIKKDQNLKMLKLEDIKSTLNSFIGDVKQIPPYFSAKKIHGVKLCDLARRDIFIRKKADIVKIYNISLLSYSNNRLKLKVLCGKGTYMRSLGRDIAYKLNTFGYIDRLKRIGVGEFDIKHCSKIEDLRLNGNKA